ncbi:MAG: glycerate kinase [Hyphomicrobiales bacterium]
MKILITTDSFKNCLSSKQVATSLKAGLLKVDNNHIIDIIPIADGGEGSLDVLSDHLQLERQTVSTKDPLGNIIRSDYALSLNKDIAFIEMAKTSGLELLQHQDKKPLVANTFGTGQLIIDALDRGITNIVITLGGSATNDGGIGMAAALGYQFYDKKNKLVEPLPKNINSIHRIATENIHPMLKSCSFTAACDVKNPFTGKEGTSYVFGKQKGANSSEIKFLDQSLLHLSSLIQNTFGINMNTIPGSGAAGGLGGGLIAFTNAKLINGFGLMKDITNIETHIKSSDLIITGEGKIDQQTKFGKLPYSIGMICKKHNIPTIAICGIKDIKTTDLKEYGIDCIMSICDRPMSIEESIKKAPFLLEETGALIGQLLKISSTLL